MIASLTSLPAAWAQVHDGYFVDLFVRKSNAVAIAMYEKFGYTKYREVRDGARTSIRERELGAESSCKLGIAMYLCATTTYGYYNRDENGGCRRLGLKAPTPPPPPRCWATTAVTRTLMTCARPCQGTCAGRQLSPSSGPYGRRSWSLTRRITLE